MARRVVIVLFEDMQSLDVTGPLEAFVTATRLGCDPAYEIVTAAVQAGVVKANSGLGLVADAALADIDPATIDTLVVAGGLGVHAVVDGPVLVPWIRGAAPHARRVTSICTGAFLLAAAGVLDGKRATTHWASAEALAERHPLVDVDPDPIFVRDGCVATSAGVTAGIDLALALIEEDHGPVMAREVARWLVMFLQRPGGQSQFSSHLRRPLARAERDGVRAAQDYVADHYAADCSVAALARHAHMSSRTFARVFRAEVGATPADWVEGVRIEAARTLLEAGPAGVEAIGRQCGFGTPETFHRAFVRRVGVTPGAYRSRFSRKES